MSGTTSFWPVLLIVIALLPLALMAEVVEGSESRFPLRNDDECWKRLPPTEKGGGQALPSWAKALAGPMPRTTAALLRLDFVHRTCSPLDAKLRAQMRWVAAHANHCAYAESYAAFDAIRAGLNERSRLLAGSDWSSFPAEEQRAFAFARKLTRYPGRISTEDINSLKHDLGADRALFLLMYACRCNYMTRISNGFQLSLERDNVFFEYYADDQPR
jgi:alkylhydroperoxidase family enzyme